MATSKSSTEQTSVIRIDIDGKKYRLQLSNSSSAAELRTILFERYHISCSTRFLDSEGYSLFLEDEQSITINHLLTKDNIIQLKTDESHLTPIPIPENKNKSSEKIFDLKYIETISQSTKASSRELKLPGSPPVRTENKIVLATDLNRDMWQKIFFNCNLLRGIRMDKETPSRAFRSVLKFKELDVDFILFQLTDDSYIGAYMNDKEMQSSFVSSQFFGGGIEFSSPFIGIGISAVYLKSKATTNTQKKTYLTYCFNFRRVTLELDSSYLEPTSEFIEAIDTVLSIVTPDEQIIKLEEVLSIYGHVYPRLIVLGGHLHHTEIHENKEKAEEAKKRISANTFFSASIIQPAKIHAGTESEKQSQNKSSEQTSLLTCEVVGGDTRYNRDPTLWTNTIAEPSLWRIIEQDNYQSTITLLDQERQQNIEKIFNYYSIKKRYLNTKWKQHGLTIAGGNGYGNQLNQLYAPENIFIDDDQTIYIADFYNHRVVEWKSNATKGQIVIGGKGNQTNQLYYPRDVIVDKENNFLIIADRRNRRVMRWSRQNNTENGEIIIENIHCWSLAIDKNGNLYVSDFEKHEVSRWKKGEKQGTIVAGGNGEGDNLNQLNWPTNIFIDEDDSLYVSDSLNHRVMKWTKDAKEGIIVAGGNGRGSSLRQLSYPYGVVVDSLGQIYVVDNGNYRVMRWCHGAKEGTIIVGGNGKGQKSNQFEGPYGLSFDRQGNLYVADCNGHRIQKFEVD